LEQFIVINDNLKRLARDFISTGKREKESKTAERQRVSVCKRQSIAGRGR
jgi:hypothetical protein